MLINFLKNTVLLLVLVLISCGSGNKSEDRRPKLEDQITKTEVNGLNTEDWQLKTIVVGANQTETYLPLLNGKKVGIVANQTSVIFKVDEKEIAFDCAQCRLSKLLAMTTICIW